MAMWIEWGARLASPSLLEEATATALRHRYRRHYRRHRPCFFVVSRGVGGAAVELLHYALPHHLQLLAPTIGSSNAIVPPLVGGQSSEAATGATDATDATGPGAEAEAEAPLSVSGASWAMPCKATLLGPCLRGEGGHLEARPARAARLAPRTAADR